MPQNKTITFKPQEADAVSPPILEKILEQYKYFRGFEFKENPQQPKIDDRYVGSLILHTNFGADGELQSISGNVVDHLYAGPAYYNSGRVYDSSPLVLLPQRTADGFIFNFFGYNQRLRDGACFELTPKYSPSTGRIVKVGHLTPCSTEFNNCFKDLKILYSTSAEIISQYLIDEENNGGIKK